MRSLLHNMGFYPCEELSFHSLTLYLTGYIPSGRCPGRSRRIPHSWWGRARTEVQRKERGRDSRGRGCTATLRRQGSAQAGFGASATVVGDDLVARPPGHPVRAGPVHCSRRRTGAEARPGSRDRRPPWTFERAAATWAGSGAATRQPGGFVVQPSGLSPSPLAKRGLVFHLQIFYLSILPPFTE